MWQNANIMTRIRTRYEKPEFIYCFSFTEIYVVPYKKESKEVQGVFVKKGL